MKILRKRVGSLLIDNILNSKYEIKNDSIYLQDKIVFNYLPIKNLTFFSLKIEKSNIDSKYWIFLDLKLYDLYKELLNGKIIIRRDLIFDMIKSSLNRLKISDVTINKFNIKKYNNINDVINEEEFKLDNIYCFEKKFVKYGKIYFDINKNLITIDKCKKKRIKLPSFIIIQDYNTIISIIKNLNLNNNDVLFIINKDNLDIIESKLFNIFNNVIYSEDINFQMKNYSKEINNHQFLTQLEFESNNFFYSKKNIFILANNLSKQSINYLSFCSFEKIFIFNLKNINDIIIDLTYNFNNLRICKNDDDNNILISNYILLKKIYIIEPIKINKKYSNIQIKNFPYINWIKKYDSQFLSLNNNYHDISDFVKIGINNNWSESYIENLKEKTKYSNNICPISLQSLSSFGIITQCNHCFELDNIIKWFEKSNECPICRKYIDINNLKFITNPDFSKLLNILANIKEYPILIICNNLWYNQLFTINSNMITSLKIITQKQFINNEINFNDNSKIINFSGLFDNDIIYINKINKRKNINIIKLIN